MLRSLCLFRCRQHCFGKFISSIRNGSSQRRHRYSFNRMLCMCGDTSPCFSHSATLIGQERARKKKQKQKKLEREKMVWKMTENTKVERIEMKLREQDSICQRNQYTDGILNKVKSQASYTHIHMRCERKRVCRH